jgi:hypothetical protein
VTVIGRCAGVLLVYPSSRFEVHSTNILYRREVEKLNALLSFSIVNEWWMKKKIMQKQLNVRYYTAVNVAICTALTVSVTADSTALITKMAIA